MAAADSATVERHEPPAAGRPPDRRLRVRRPLRRDPADRGRRDGLRRDRAGGRWRRGLARRRRPRRLLRHPEPALLVLVRPQPGLELVLLAATGDPGLPP